MKNDFANITVYRHSLIISLDLLFILILVSSLLCGLASNFFYRLYKTTTHKTFLSQNKTRLIHLEICLVKTVNKHHFVIMCICYTKNFAAWKVSICEVFLVRIFLYLEWIQEKTNQKNSVFGAFSHSVFESGYT